MKTIAIYCHSNSKEFLLNAIFGKKIVLNEYDCFVENVSRILVNRGFEIFVFCDVDGEYNFNGIRYINKNGFADSCKKIKFDHIILSESVTEINSILGGNVYVIPHDNVIIGYEKVTDEKITKVFYNSEYQLNILRKKYHIPEKKLMFVRNGINQDGYDKYSGVEKKNRMVMPINMDCGTRWVVEKVFPKIREEIIDFDVYVNKTSINGNPIFLDQEWIKVVDLSRRDLLEELQSSSKIFIYPNHGYDYEYNKNYECYNSSLIENAYSKNACILGEFGFAKTILNGYNGFVGNKLYNGTDDPMAYDNLDEFADILAEEAIKCMKDEEYRLSMVESSYEISKKYKWEKTCDMIENELNKLEKTVGVYVMSMKDYPYLAHDETYIPIQIGTEQSDEKLFEYQDNCGNDNISSKNRYYAETTGIYWIWKNSKKYDYIGQENYRRHFNLNKNDIRDILGEKDIIIGKKVNTGQDLYYNYEFCHIKEFMDKCLDSVKELYPEIFDDFEQYMKTEKHMYCANSYITTYEKYNEINTFIFNVLFDVEKMFGYKTEDQWREYVTNSGQKNCPPHHLKKGLTYVDYQLFQFSFLYERLLTFYIHQKNMSVHEVDFYSTESEYKSRTLKTMMVSIARLENKYIREFVEFYKTIGITNICLCDNNRDGEDDFNDVIGDYIKDGFVILKDYRNRQKPIQAIAYDECYEEYKNDYDWFLFFDIDEFLFLNKDKNIKNYLSRMMFDDYDMIHLNWLKFGDNGFLVSDGRPVLERFKTPLDLNQKVYYDFPDNFHIKSIVRGGLDFMKFKTPHTPEIHGRCCNASGIKCDGNSPFSPYDYRYAGIRHYCTKTAYEYADKVNRGFCDTNVMGKEDMISLFFKQNEITEEKIEIFKSKCGIDKSYLLKNEFKGTKSDEIKIYTLCYANKDFAFLDDAVITPLQVGASNGTDICKLKDNTLDNISDKNYFYVEGTGTYWIWKNVNNAKYKGQMQYRRPLSGVTEKMDFDEIFGDYDVITCKPFNHPENSKPTAEQQICIPAKTVEEGYKFSNCIDDLVIIELVVKMYHPEYSDDYDKYIKKGENLYYSNGFIMRSEDYDKYAEFLFDCLGHYLEFTNIKNEENLINHVKYNLEVGKYIRYSREEINNPNVIRWQSEIGGFLSERIWTLWLLHNFNKDRIYELPYIKMENNMYT